MSDWKIPLIGLVILQNSIDTHGCNIPDLVLIVFYIVLYCIIWYVYTY